MTCVAGGMRRATFRRVSIAGTDVTEQPPRAVWQLDQLRVAAECRAAGAVGGDFYVVARRDTGCIAVVIGDACGRGRDGARLLPTFLPRVRELASSGVQPARMLSELNHSARHLLPLDRFVTLAMVEIDPLRDRLVVSSAGHVPPLIRSSAGVVSLVGRASGPPLGIAPDAAYTEERRRFAGGDLLVLMTDGLLETVEIDLANMTSLQALLAAAPEDAVAAHRTLLAAFDGMKDRHRQDDVTLVCVESTSPAKRLAA